MREHHWIMSDYIRRKLFIKYEIKRKILKSIFLNNYIPNTHRYVARHQYSKTHRWAILPQQVNRCFITGRQWAVHANTRYSRFKFRTESNTGNLPGFKRASW